MRMCATARIKRLSAHHASNEHPSKFIALLDWPHAAQAPYFASANRDPRRFRGYLTAVGGLQGAVKLTPKCWAKQNQLHFSPQYAEPKFNGPLIFLKWWMLNKFNMKCGDKDNKPPMELSLTFDPTTSNINPTSPLNIMMFVNVLSSFNEHTSLWSPCHTSLYYRYII